MPVPNSPRPPVCSRHLTAEHVSITSNMSLVALTPASASDAAPGTWDEIGNCSAMHAEGDEHSAVFLSERQIPVTPRFSCDTAFDCNEATDQRGNVDWQVADD